MRLRDHKGKVRNIGEDKTVYVYCADHDHRKILMLICSKPVFLGASMSKNKAIMGIRRGDVMGPIMKNLSDIFNGVLVMRYPLTFGFNPSTMRTVLDIEENIEVSTEDTECVVDALYKLHKGWRFVAVDSNDELLDIMDRVGI